MTQARPRDPAQAEEVALDDRELFVRARRDSDRGARDELVRRYMPLARSLARRYAYSAIPLEDLEQVACLALVKAVERFDESRDVAFTTFAVPTIAGELHRHMRDHERTVRVPRSLHERIVLVNRAVRRLSAERGRAPTAGEIATATGLVPEQVVEALDAQLTADVVSLDAPLPGPGSEPLVELIASGESGYGAVEERAALTPALRALPAAERVVVHLRFERDLTQSEIAARLGVSQVQVSRLLRRALERLRASAARHDA